MVRFCLGHDSNICRCSGSRSRCCSAVGIGRPHSSKQLAAASVRSDGLLKHVVCVCFQDLAETLSQSFIDHMSVWTGNTIQTRLHSPGPRPCERASVQHLLTEVFLSFITNSHHFSLRDKCIFCSITANIHFSINVRTPRTVRCEALWSDIQITASFSLKGLDVHSVGHTRGPSVRLPHGSLHEIFKVQ